MQNRAREPSSRDIRTMLRERRGMLVLTGGLLIGSSGVYLAAVIGLFGIDLGGQQRMPFTSLFLIQILTAIALVQLTKRVFPKPPEEPQS